MNDVVLVRLGSAERHRARRGLRPVAVRPSASLLTAALLLAPTPSRANPDGRQINRAAVGCGAAGSCHGTNPGAMATLTGPSTALPGARSTYVLSLRSTLAGFTGGGFDLAVRGPAGTALAVHSAQPNTRLNGTDLVMNSRFAAAAGAVTVTFDLLTPTAGAVTLNAVGNATNGVGSAGDAWALTSLAVTVAPPALTDAGAVDVVRPQDSGNVPVDAGRVPVDAGDAATADAGDAATADTGLEAYDPTVSYGYGGCSVGAGDVPVTALRWAWLLALGWVARRRRGGGHA